MRDKESLLDSKAKLREWIQLDRVSCGYTAKQSFKEKLVELITPNYILIFLKQLRTVEYLTNCETIVCRDWRLLFNRIKLRRMQLRLGYTIPINVFGPGLSLAHYGTIVVSQYASVGSNCRLHVGVNIGASSGYNNAPTIGNNVYIGPGAILFGDINIADNVSVGANSTVTHSFEKKNTLVVGTPAKVVRENIPAWNM